MSQAARYLLCTDLDRTLLPNGTAEESPGARVRFARLVNRPEVALAYVTGRHRELVQAAIDEYALPMPDYVVGDVGTSIWSLAAGNWRPWDSWDAEIAADWAGWEHEHLAQRLADFRDLRRQEPEKQNRHKLSYYAPANTDVTALQADMHARLGELGVRAALIWSLDESTGTGLLDVLPERATKLHAVEFLIAQEGFSSTRTVFSGDSGNDLPVLVSPLPSVLVANASEEVREQAMSEAQRRGTVERLYLAHGGFLGMNGNYSAGILEGVVHFLPEAAAWLAPAEILPNP